ncbi:MAG: glycosyltransferase family 4 protein [Bacteroidales bacterium]|nr:glycosyltransferase family 4 protein [Bacteroidales bacterium]
MKPKELQKKKIIFFTVESPPSFAGAGLKALEFARFLSNYAQETSLCHLNYNGILPNEAVDGKLKIHRLNYFNKNILTKIISFIPLLFRYFKLVKKNDIIFIYSAYLIGFQFIIYAAFLLKKKIIFRSTLLMGDDVATLLKKPALLRWINKYVIKRISVYFAINAEFTRRFRNSITNNIPVFESFQGVNINRFKPVSSEKKKQIREKLSIDPEEFIIVSVGFVLRRKGYQFIFPQLSNLPFSFRYIILGEFLKNHFHRTTDDEIAEMESVVKQGKLLLGNKVIFAGTANNIEDYLLAADIFIHGSLGEGTPNVVLEALSCGIPVIIRRLPGLSRQLIHNRENAVEFENFDELPHILEELFNNKQLRSELGKAGSKTITENYTFEKVASKLMGILYA